MGNVLLTKDEIQQYDFHDFNYYVEAEKIRPHLKILTNWNFKHVVEMYLKFKKYSGERNYLYISFRTFQEISPLSNIVSKAAFDYYKQYNLF